MQELEPSESCADPVFCMRPANLTSRADVTSTCAILGREHANLGFEADLPQKIGFFRGRIGVTNHYQIPGGPPPCAEDCRIIPLDEVDEPTLRYA